MRILLVADDPQFTELFSVGFLYEGCEVVAARTRKEAIESALKRRPDVVLIALPITGCEIPGTCRSLRSQNNVGVLLVGAPEPPESSGPFILVPRSECWQDDPEHAVDTPDGYLAEPFTFRDALALTYATVGSRSINLERVLSAGDIVMDRQTLRVQCHGQEVHLTLNEYNLLELFLLHPGQVFTEGAIFARVWGYDYYGETNSVGVAVSNLRRKLGSCGAYLRTIRGAGYVLQLP